MRSLSNQIKERRDKNEGGMFMDFKLTEDQQMLQKMAKNLASEKFKPKAFTWDKTDEYPWENLKTLATHGLIGITLPQEDGGGGGAVFDAVLVIEQIAMVCPHTADLVQLGNFGAIRALSQYGSKELKMRVLPILLKGETTISTAMSEPDAGSAATDLRAKGRIEGDTVVIDGSKIFNTNPQARFFLVWLRFGNDVKSSGAVIVERETPGFLFGKMEKFMSGQSHCMLYFDQCRVPLQNVVLREDGFRKLLTAFNVERAGNATRSLALAQLAFDLAVEHAKVREQFGRPISEFQGIQWKFAEMKMKLDAARLLIYRAVVNAGDGRLSAVETAVAKAFTNEAAFWVANEALQIMGGYGYSTEFPFEYILRRVRGWMIGGGTTEMMKNRIAEGIFDRHFSQRPPKRS